MVLRERNFPFLKNSFLFISKCTSTEINITEGKFGYIDETEIMMYTAMDANCI